MNWLTLAPVATLVFAVAIYIHRNVRAIFPEDAPDAPESGGRKRHNRPTPLAGWLLGLMMAAICHDPWLSSAILLVTWIGYRDDRTKNTDDDLPGPTWHAKLRWQIAACLLATIFLQKNLQLDAVESTGAFLLLLVLTNAANFLDNTNGVCLGLSCFALWFAGRVDHYRPEAWFYFAAAIPLGLLPLNWPRPILFIGDAGALALGLCVGCGAVYVGYTPLFPPGRWLSDEALGPLRALLPVGIFVIDFVQVILARIVVGVSPWIGDRRHLTHVVQNLGMPTTVVAPTFVAIAAALALGLIAVE